MPPELDDPLRTPVTYLKGVGSQRAELLNRLGLRRAFDLLFYFPRDYQDMTDRRDVANLEEGKQQTVQGVIDSWEQKNSRRGPMITLNVDCGGGFVRGLWFKMPYIIREFAKGRRLLLTGKPRFDYPFWVMTHPQLTYLTDEEENDDVEPFLPVYPLTEGLRQHHLRRILRDMLPKYGPLLDEVFPEDFLDRNGLLPIAEAVSQIHFPSDKEMIQKARRRFVYQELFILQLGLSVRQLQHRTRFKASPLPVDKTIDSRIRQRFPFELTKAQEKVVAEIANDLARPVPMNRLLQGDVGSGKTVVALYAMLAAVANGHQAVFMAPTEVLARQHLRTLENTPS